MSFTSNPLKGLENFGKKPKPKEKKPTKVVEPVLPPDDDDEDFKNEDDKGNQIIRNPRIIPAAQVKKVDKLRNEEFFQPANNAFGVQEVTRERREQVLNWMLNGHLHNGRLMSVTDLADALQVPLKTVERDIVELKEKMAQYHTESDTKDIPALAYMLLEMKFQDRGRALALYNIIMGDIKDADDNEVEFTDKNGKKRTVGALTGRDRAAMYSAALAAMDLASKATNGMDSLFKMTGGAQKLQQIIHAKNLQINTGQGQTVTMGNLMDLAANELAGVLPSARKQKALPAPKIIELTDEDEEIMAVGVRERGNK